MRTVYILGDTGPLGFPGPDEDLCLSGSKAGSAG